MPMIDLPIVEVSVSHAAQAFVPVGNVKKSLEPSIEDIPWSQDLLDDSALDSSYDLSDLVAVKKANPAILTNSITRISVPSPRKHP